eukprot:868412-Amphidinium_carterae.3
MKTITNALGPQLCSHRTSGGLSIDIASHNSHSAATMVGFGLDIGHEQLYCRCWPSRPLGRQRQSLWHSWRSRWAVRSPGLTHIRL